MTIQEINSLIHAKKLEIHQLGVQIAALKVEINSLRQKYNIERIKCPKCKSYAQRKGKSHSGEQRFVCPKCNYHFGENSLSGDICGCGKAINHRGVCTFRYQQLNPIIKRKPVVVGLADCGVCPIVSTGDIKAQITCPRHGM